MPGLCQQSLLRRGKGGLAVLFVMAVDVHPIIFTEVFASTVMELGLATLSTNYNIGLWVFSYGFQLFGAPVWSSGYSLADRYIIVTLLTQCM